MIEAKVSFFLWPHFFESTVDFMNFIVNNKTKGMIKVPYEAFMDENQPGLPHTVDLTNCRTPGSTVFVHIPEQRRKNAEKFSPNGERGMLLG